MALYKYPQFLGKSDHELFDKLFNPGAETPYSGIYRCEECGREVTSVHPHPLPSQNHHQHAVWQGKIRWRLVACHDSK